MKNLLLQGAGGGNESLYAFLAILAAIGILFFIFKAGEWYGKAKIRKSKNDSAVMVLMVMPDSGGGEWVLVVFLFLVLFFIFKAGEWYGKSKEKGGN